MSRGKRVTELSPEQVTLLQQDWKVGALPVPVIALKYGGLDIDDLRETAKRERWSEDHPRETSQPLQQQIEQAALEATVDRVVSDDDREQGRTEPRLLNQGETIKQFAMVVAGVEAQQRSDIKRARTYAATLMQQLEELVGPHVEKERVEALAALIADTDPELAKLLVATPEPRDFAAALQVIDRKAGVLLKVVAAMKDLFVLERQSYGLDKPGGAKAGYDELLQKVIDDRLKTKRNYREGTL